MLLAVPNVSEGRDESKVERLAEAFSSSARLLAAHSDPDHHRSVFVLAGEADALAASLVAGVARARELIDLRLQDGVHPRVGATDVVPVVPVEADGMETAKETALEVAETIGRELGLPVFLYGGAGAGRRPVFFRRGGLDELRRRVDARELVPDFGPLAVDARSGAVLVGARKPLVAYNVELATADVAVARRIAAAVRESSGGMPGVQAIGLQLPRSGRIQVSMNVVDLDRSPLHEVVAQVREEAEREGVRVFGGELVGLVPEQVLDAARAAGAEVPGVDEAHVIERLLAL
ncbi:MAG TPA: glutamate formimidoyltransferase [Gaiellaceae bacterium]|nr:glutamate formimidoyltransferase [Gaiellaceae bacterium]